MALVIVGSTRQYRKLMTLWPNNKVDPFNPDFA